MLIPKLDTTLYLGKGKKEEEGRTQDGLLGFVVDVLEAIQNKTYISSTFLTINFTKACTKQSGCMLTI